MIELEVAVEMIPYIRTIEGRKFHNGKWQFPDSSLPTLQKYGLVDDEYKVEEKIIKQYDISPFLYGYQKEVVNKALNEEGYGLFLDTGCGKSICGLEIAKHIGKTLVLCPLSVIETAWIDDCHNFYPDMNIVNCHGIKILERNDNVDEAIRRNMSDVGQFDGIEDEVDYILTNNEFQFSVWEMAKKVHDLYR